MLEIVGHGLIQMHSILQTFGTTQLDELSFSKFLFLTVFIQIDYQFILHYFNYYVVFSPGVLFLAYVVELIFVAIAFNTIAIFLGSYTKSMIIRIWNCVPLFKGAGYTFLIVHMIDIINSQYYTSTYVYIWMHYLRFFKQHTMNAKGAGWQNCSFPGSDYKCLPIADKEVVCDLDIRYELSLFQFMRVVIFKQSRPLSWSYTYHLHSDLYIINISLWLIIILCCYINLQRLLTLIILGVSACFICFTTIFSIIIFTAPAADESSLNYLNLERQRYSADFLLQTEYWCITMMHASGVINLGAIFWMSTMKPQSVKPNLATNAIQFCNMVLLFSCIIVLKFLLDKFINMHKRIFDKCLIQINGEHIFLPIVLDIFHHFDQSELWSSLYLFALIVYSSLHNIVKSIMITDTIIDEYPRLAGYRMYVAIAQGLLGGVASYMMFTENALTLIFLWQAFGIAYIASFLFCIFTVCICYVYTLEMMERDYIFTYKEQLSNILKVAWSTLPVIGILSVASMIYSLKIDHYTEMHSKYKLGVEIAAFIVLIPIFVGIAIRTVDALKFNGPFDTPTPSWGPYNEMQKYRRDRFMPHRELCYRRASMTCTHKCLAKVRNFDDVCHEEYEKYRNAMNTL